jgi:formate hydrogenlyase subunit 3/multisubunit Na+/H+ antiporter MnhD subunit
MNVIALAVGAAVFFLGISLRPDSSFREARRRASIGLAGATAFSAAGWVFANSQRVAVQSLLQTGVGLDAGTGFPGVVPFVICLLGVVAVALSDSISHRVLTLKRVLYLLALAMVFVGSTEPVVLGLCWTLSPLVVWAELRSRDELSGVSRLFAVFHVPSVVLFIAAMVAYELDGTLLFVVAALVAIGIREAVIPGHSWFVRFVEEAPMGLVVAFVGPQLGVYAHIELLAQSVPPELAHTVAGFGALTALLASVFGVVQTSARRGLAYLMMSQTGLVAFGIEGTSAVAFAGSLVAWQVLAVATTGFAMTLSALEARRGELSLSGFSGCFSRTPRMAAGFLMMGLGSVGFPLTLGFVAEDLLVQGSVEEFPLQSLVLIVATAFNGMNVMRSFFHLFSGMRAHTGEADLTKRESRPLSAVLVFLLVGGLVPGAITSHEFDGSGSESEPIEYAAKMRDCVLGPATRDGVASSESQDDPFENVELGSEFCSARSGFEKRRWTGTE